MLSRETCRSSFGIVGDRVLLGVGHAAALHSGRPRDILCGTPTLSARETFGALVSAMSTLPQTFEHAVIGSDFSKSHRADKSSQRACRGRTINGGYYISTSATAK